MNTLELKKDFHNLIDSIDNETLLSDFYILIKERLSGKDGKLWKGLTTWFYDNKTGKSVL